MADKVTLCLAPDQIKRKHIGKVVSLQIFDLGPNKNILGMGTKVIGRLTSIWFVKETCYISFGNELPTFEIDPNKYLAEIYVDK